MRLLLAKKISLRPEGFPAAIAIGLFWIFLLPQAQDETNLHVLALLAIILLLVVVGPMTSWKDYRTLLWLFLPIGAITGVSVVTSAWRMAGVTSIREVFLVLTIFVAGVLLSRAAGLHYALLGILAGSALVTVMGWFLGLDDSIFSSVIVSGADFRGFADQRAYEYLSNLMGIAAGLALIRRDHWSRFAVAPVVGFLAFNLVLTGSFTGRVAIAANLLTFVLLIVSRTRFAGVAAWSSLILAIVASVSITFFVIFQERALSITSDVGKFASLDARFMSWISIIRTLDPLGALFGYGTTFWQKGSPTRDLANEPLQDLNYGPFDIAHSMYLDALVAFGILGMTIIALLIWNSLRSTLPLRTEASKWVEYSSPWIFGAALAIQGLTDSFVAFRPSGWLLLGLLYGAFSIGFRPLNLVMRLSRRRPAQTGNVSTTEPAHHLQANSID